MSDDETEPSPAIHNLLAAADDHSNLCYDPASVSAVIGVDLTDGDDGHVHGSTFIPGARFAQMMGQSDPDTVRLQTVSAVGATTSFGAELGAHLHFGEKGEGQKALQTFDRVMHVVPDGSGAGNVITTHFTIPAATSAGTATGHFPPHGLGSVKLENPLTTKLEHQIGTARAFQRNLRWQHALNKTPEELAKSCTKVGSGTAARFLVPIDGAQGACPMGTLIRGNVEKNAATFCGGNYAPDRRSTTTNAKGEQCTVMAAKDFQAVFAQLHDNLKPKADVQHGLTLQMRSLEPAQVGQGVPRVQMHAKFDRMTTAHVMDVDHAPVIDKLAAMSMLGETPEPGFATYTTGAGGSKDQLAERVFALKLAGEETEVGTAFAAPGALDNVVVGTVTDVDAAL